MPSLDVSGPTITFTTSTTVVTLGPLWVDPTVPWRRADGAHDFIFGSIVATNTDGERLERSNENGFESLALALFRDAISAMVRDGKGSLTLADHDGMFMELRFMNAGEVAVTFDDLRSEPHRYDIDFGVMTPQALLAVADDITAVEAALGPLTGYCDACGRPVSLYRS